jgi:hypothetical protein
MLGNKGNSHTLRMCNTLLFHGRNGYTNAPQYCVTKYIVLLKMTIYAISNFTVLHAHVQCYTTKINIIISRIKFVYDIPQSYSTT